MQGEGKRGLEQFLMLGNSMFSLMGVHLVLAAGKEQASSMCQIIVLVSGVSIKGKKAMHAGKTHA